MNYCIIYNNAIVNAYLSINKCSFKIARYKRNAI